MRLIDADALFADLKHDSDICTKFLESDAGTKLQRDLIRVHNDRLVNTILSINAAPTVDAVPVIRCKDCKYYNPQQHYCEGIGNWFGYVGEWSDNGYCYKAERRKDNG